MATIASLVVKIGGDSSELRKELNAAQRQIRKAFGERALGTSRAMMGTIAGIGAGMVAAGVGAVKLAGDLQQTKVAFTSMLHSAEKADDFLKQMQQFAATTPFTFDQVSGAAQKFLAFGFEAKQVIPILTAVGDSAAALGMGQEGIDRLTLALGQMAAKGKVSGEEMKQLAEAGVPAWKMLAETLHTDVAGAMQAVQRGQVDAQTGLTALAGGMEEAFGGMMEKQSETINGMVSTIYDNLIQLGQSVGSGLVESLGINDLLKGIMTNLQDFVTQVRSIGLGEAIRQLIPPEVKIAVAGLAGAIAGTAVPAMYSFAVSTWAAMAPLIPFIAIGAAVGVSVYQLWQNFDKVKGVLAQLGFTTSAMNTIWTKTKTAIQSVLRGVASLLTALRPIIAITLAVGAVASKVFIYVIGKAIGVAISWWNKIMDVVNFFASVFAWVGEKVENVCSWVADSFGNLGDAINSWSGGALGDIVDFVKGAISWLDAIIGKIKEFIGWIGKAGDAGASAGSGGGSGKNNDIASKLKNSSFFKNFASSGGSGGASVGGGGGGGGHASGGGASMGEDLASKAKEMHESIQSIWNQAFKSKKELNEIEYREELAKLDKSKSASTTYQEDLTRLNEVYAKKRQDIATEEARQIAEVQAKVRDFASEHQNASTAPGLSGASKSNYEFAQSFAKSIDDIRNKFADLNKDYQQMDKASKEAFIASLRERGVAFKQVEGDKLDFTESINEEILAKQEEFNREEISRHRNMVAEKAQIDDAYHMASLEMLQQSLDAKTAAEINAMETNQAMMDLYKESMMDANLSMTDALAQSAVAGFGEMQKGIEGLLMGTKSLGQAFQSLGQAIIKSIAQSVAKMIAGRITTMMFGKAMAQQEAAHAQAVGAQIAGAFSSAAMTRSIAELGPIAGPSAFYAAIASSRATTALTGLVNNMGAVHGASMKALGVPMLASGGVADGPAIAMIGEGKHREAVLPLNDEVFNELGQGISRNGGGSMNVVINAPLDGRRAIGDFFAKNAETVAEALGEAHGVSVNYGGALSW